MKIKFSKDDLNQITRESLEGRSKSEIINLTLRLRDYGIDSYELLKRNSTNSSRPPSSDSPFEKRNHKDEKKEPDHDPDQADDHNEEHTEEKNESGDGKKRNPGRQPDSQGFGREQKPTVDKIENHYPLQCIICTAELSEESAIPYSAHYTFELERGPNGIRLTCTKHFYYGIICECGHENTEKPGEGFISIIEGRKQNLKLTEYTIIGPMFATFIAALSRRYGMSRKKIQEFLQSWLNFDLSIGLICKIIREAGVACYPVVKNLIEDLQKEEIVHLDETPWYQKGVFCWLWVAIGKATAVFRIGSRKKEELLHLITVAYIGWLITDGYMAYRSYDKRQRCLAHLIRKAVAISGGVDEDAGKMGDWFLRELRGLIKAMAEGDDGKKKCKIIIARLKRACKLGSKSDHAKLKSLAKEILNDWDAVVAFVKNPGLPATNNEAERALRWAVIYRKITFGTRTTEGSKSLAAMLSVIETCRLRQVDPWEYIAEVIAQGRKGIDPPKIAHA